MKAKYSCGKHWNVKYPFSSITGLDNSFKIKKIPHLAVGDSACLSQGHANLNLITIE